MGSERDIVERLRGFAEDWRRCPSGPAGWLLFPEHYREAAAEIERLRALYEAAWERCEALEHLCACYRTSRRPSDHALERLSVSKETLDALRRTSGEDA